MDNTRIETQPMGIGGVETPVISSEIETEVGAVENSSTTMTEVSPKVDTIPEPIETSVGAEVSIETPKPSAGFQIDPKSTGASKIVLEKLTNTIANL
ncbi:MAG TPA: hypothetical protein PKI16_02125 [Candidatus Dojkabacteria bacterium]|nr:hypothetical protein [Candidatus Dojkabacteria bacterium]